LTELRAAETEEVTGTSTLQAAAANESVSAVVRSSRSWALRAVVATGLAKALQ